MISKLFPELERFPTPEARRREFGLAVTQVALNWRYWAALAAIAAVEVWVQFSLPSSRMIGGWRTVLGWLIVAVTLIACWALILCFRRTIRRSLWHALAEMGVPCCTSCGYDLTGNVSGICSECGKPVERTVEQAPDAEYGENGER